MNEDSPPTFRILRRLGLLLALGLLGAWGAQRAWHKWGENFDYPWPHGRLEFDTLRPESATTLFDAQGRVIDYWHRGENLHIYRSLGQIDPKLADFVVQLEDAKFFWHKGFDVEQIQNALEEKRKVKRGASTITQQLAKNLFLDKERSFARKFFEIPWALSLERDLSKKQILELYLNVIEWGPGVYGAEAAARHFFDRPASELSVGQAPYLALIVPNPTRFDLFAHPKYGDFIEKKRAAFVERLVDEKKIDPSLKEDYLRADFGLVAPDARDRRFAPSHDAAYAGNREARSPSLLWLEASFSPSLRDSELRTSLDRDLQQQLDTVPEEASASSADRIFVLSDEGRVRALRPLRRGRGLAPDRLPSGFQTEEVENMPWKRLAL